MIARSLFLALCIVVFSNSAVAAQYYFPIIATGFTSAGSDQFYVTELIVNNPGNVKIDGFLTFYAADGTPLDVTLRFVPGTGGTPTSTEDLLQFTVPAQGASPRSTHVTAAPK